MSDTRSWYDARDAVSEQVRAAACAVQVSDDFRHRVLDAAYQQRRQEHAGQKALFVLVLLALLVSVTSGWAARCSTRDLAASAGASWAAGLIHIERPESADGRNSLSWSGWVSPRHSEQRPLATVLQEFLRARGS